MDDNQDSNSPIAPEVKTPSILDQASAYIQHPDVAVSEVKHRISGALNDADDYVKDFSAKDAAMWNQKIPGANIAPDSLYNTLQAAQGMASIGGVASNIAANPEALAGLQKLAGQAKSGLMNSAAEQIAWQKATGQMIPVAEKGLGQGLTQAQKIIPKTFFADGGEVGFDPDAFLASQSSAPADNHQDLSGFDPDEFLNDVQQEKYGGLGQQAMAGIEGVAKGIAGPLAPLAEKHLLGVKEEDIRGREEANPITQGIGQAAGLGAGMLTGTGEAAVMTKAGEMAQQALGLGKVADGVSLGYKVGSSAVQQAAEMAVLQSGDEAAKMILNDPKTSAESAIANIGLSAALGGAGGALVSGVVSPLWEATAGPKLEQALSHFKNHLDGSKLLMPEAAEDAIKTLGIEVDPVTRAGLSRDPRTLGPYSTLREAQNKTVLEGIQNLERNATDSVANALGVLPEDVAVHSENEAGHNLLETFKKEYNEKYAPIADALEKRNKEAAMISIPDEARLDQYGKMIEEAMQKVGTDSPAYKLYNDYGNRLLAKETIGGVDMLKTELNGEISKAVRAGDTNAMQALRDIRSSLADFQENQITKEAMQLEKSGIKTAGKSAEQLIAERANTNRSYADFAKMSNELTDHLGIGSFTGAKGLQGKLTDKVSAEQLLNKFSFKGNADFIPFLQKNFPEVLERVKDNELKRFLKPAVLSAKGEAPINIKRLGDILDKAMAGQKEYAEAILPQGAIQKIQAARDLMETIPGHKSSHTAGWMAKMYEHMPASAMAAVGMITGHNPITSGIMGHAAQLLGRDAPDAVRLGYLKFLASDQPIKAEGFKAMVDYIHNTVKGENLLSKATRNIFKAGAQVLTDSQRPNEADRTRLDKQVTKAVENPEALMQRQDIGHLGHYLPDHQVAITGSALSAVKYLSSLKPHPQQLSPMDKPIPPTPAQEARYQRALNIAQQPAVVLEHIKNGTIQPSDIQDLKAMYPGVYQNMAQKMTNEIGHKRSDDQMVPYSTRMGMSLFLGQPLDATMTPSAIVSAQPKAPQGAQQGSQKPPPASKTNKLGKSNKQYMTPGQAAEADRSSRE